MAAKQNTSKRLQRSKRLWRCGFVRSRSPTLFWSTRTCATGSLVQVDSIWHVEFAARIMHKLFCTTNNRPWFGCCSSCWSAGVFEMIFIHRSLSHPHHRCYAWLRPSSWLEFVSYIVNLWRLACSCCGGSYVCWHGKQFRYKQYRWLWEYSIAAIPTQLRSEKHQGSVLHYEFGDSRRGSSRTPRFVRRVLQVVGSYDHEIDRRRIQQF